jgi:hypothetical protein
MIHWIVINVFQNQEFQVVVPRLIVLREIIGNVIYYFHWIIVYSNLQVHDNVQQIVMIPIDIDYIMNGTHRIQYVISLPDVDELRVHQSWPYEL